MARRFCPVCGLSVQRTVEGTLDDGLNAHLRVVHPGHKLVPVSMSEGKGEAPRTLETGTFPGGVPR